MKLLSTLYKQLYFVIVTLFILGVSFSTHAQIITTIAGNGTPTYGGDGGSAIAAGIHYPTHATTNNSGNLYFGDFLNYRIRELNSTGILTTIAGNGSYGFSGDGGPATASSNSGPAGVAIDSSGNIYFADYYVNRIRKVSSSGIITTIAGTGIPGFSGDGGPATAAQIDTAWGIAVDSSGNIYFSDRYNNRIRKISSLGIISTIAGNGTPGFTGDGGPATAAELFDPVDIALDKFGNLYFSNFLDNRVRKINNMGIITTIAGNGVAGFSGDGALATTAEIHNPIGIAVDAVGNIYIGDNGNNRVRKVNTSGIITTIAGNGIPGYSGDGGPATAAELNGPYGVGIFPSGNIYVCDASNYRIRMINTGNHPPAFIAGNIQSLTICTNEVPATINSLLAIVDTDAGQTENWSLTTPPIHGTVAASYSAVSTGGILTPVGLNYTPLGGYIGSDMFMVSVTDGIATTTVTINVTIYPIANAGIISGTDSVCPGNSVSLSETVSDGIWSASHIAISTVSNSGIVAGISPGNDTVIYTIVSPCGIVSAIFPFKVEPYSFCRTAVNTIAGQNIGITANPNPSYGVLTVNLSSDFDEEVRFTITNMLGQKVKELTAATNNPSEIKLDSPPGMYFLSAITEHGKYVEKVIIEK